MTKGLVAKKSYFAAVQCLDIDTVNAYLAQGGDWGATISNWLAYDHFKSCKAILC